MALRLDSKQDVFWLKPYLGRTWTRRSSYRVWNGVTRLLGLRLLQAPPYRPGLARQAIEKRRLAELDAMGVRVPTVLSEGKRVLVLDNLGPSLSSVLKQHRTREATDQPVREAARALADVHARGGYLGQAFPRNIAYADGKVGFLDFEEDPLEILSLAEAQARDWVFFVYGLARYFVGRPASLARLVNDQRKIVADQVQGRVRGTTTKLDFLAPHGKAVWARGSALVTAVIVLQQTFPGNGPGPF